MSTKNTNNLWHTMGLKCCATADLLLNKRNKSWCIFALISTSQLKITFAGYINQKKLYTYISQQIHRLAYLTRGPMFSDGRDWRREGPADTGRICNKFITWTGHYVWTSADMLCLLFYFHVLILLPTEYHNAPQMEALNFIIHPTTGNTNIT
jgi:hypothetical protein